jgi:hypothetical protein
MHAGSSMCHSRSSRDGSPHGAATSSRKTTATSRKATATTTGIRGGRGEQHDGEQSGGTRCDERNCLHWNSPDPQDPRVNELPAR